VTTRTEFTDAVRQAVLDSTSNANIPSGYRHLVDRVITAVQDTCTLALDEAAEAIRSEAQEQELMSERDVNTFLNTTILGRQEQAATESSDGDAAAEIAALRETVARLSEFARANGFRG